MKKIYLFLIGFLTVMGTDAQIVSPIPSSSAVANTAAADVKDRTPFHNPACWSQCSQPQLISSFENRYIIAALATKSVMALYPFKQFVGSLSFAHQGFAQYHEMIAGTAFVRDFSGKFSMGLQFNYHTVYFETSDKYRGILYPQIGCIIPYKDRWIWAFHVCNPFATNIQAETLTKYIPSTYSLGCSYAFNPDFSWRMQADKELRSTYRIATAFDYQMSKYNRVQLGLYLYDVPVACLGFGLNFKAFGFDLLSEMHPQLGLNCISQVRINMGKEVKNTSYKRKK